MAVRRILQIGEPLLREPAREVTLDELASVEVQDLIDDLVDTMHDASGAGLAATQVGVGFRIVVIEMGPSERFPNRPTIPLTVLVNPVLTPVSEATFDQYEGCLSVPGYRAVVTRDAEVRVTALDRKGVPVDHVVRGLGAGVHAHEVDHLDGILYLDRVTDPTTITTAEAFEAHHLSDWLAAVDRLVERWGG